LLSIAGFSDCVNCPLHSSCISPNIKPDGPLNSRILIVGEAPGKDEDVIGKPFVGKAGQWLNQALAEADLDRNSLLITNTCRCFPKQNEGNKPTKKQ